MEKQREPFGVNRPGQEIVLSREILQERAIKICDNFLGLWLGQCNGFFIAFLILHFALGKIISIFFLNIVILM